MKLLLDTTYLLPAIGISIKEIPTNTILELMKQGNQIFISEISIFELTAIGAKHVLSGLLPAERVTKGIRAIVYDETIEAIPIHETRILLTAFKLRRLLVDFMDCLILSSAMNQCDTLITEDSDIQKLKESEKFKELLTTVNPNFQIKALTRTT